MALAHAFAWFDHALPVERGDGVESEDFDAAVVGEEAGAGDADIVEDDEVALLEEGREVAEAAVFEGLGVAVDDEHAGGVALRERAAGDELGREVVVEVVGAEHRGGVRVGVGEEGRKKRRVGGFSGLRDQGEGKWSQPPESGGLLMSGAVRVPMAVRGSLGNWRRHAAERSGQMSGGNVARSS